MQTLPKILAIETSCDETAAAVVSGTSVLGQETYSQLESHAGFGGVVPSVAKLEHERKIEPVINAALNRANLYLNDIDALAVTIGPGLAIALEIGVEKAKQLAVKLNKPLISVNHMHGHLFSAFAGEPFESAQFPALGVLVSGGHSELILATSFTNIKKVAETLDDACGEAFDKFARIVGLPYPGGPEISKRAKEVESVMQLSTVQENGTLFCIAKRKETGKEYRLPVPMAKSKSANLSYSGLKTAVKNIVTAELNVTEHQNIQDISSYIKQHPLDSGVVDHLCYLFQATAILQIRISTEKVLAMHPEIKEIWLGGGVVANEYLRAQVRELAESRGLKLRLPTRELSTDNAAMIGIAASIQWINQLGVHTERQEIEQIDRNPNLEIPN